MNKYGKQIFFWSLVVIVSAGVSTGTYKLLNRNEIRAFKNDSLASYAKPVVYEMTSQHASFDTDFTSAAEKTINGVVHIKSTVMTTSRGQIDPFELFFGNRGRSQQPQPQPKVGYGSGVIISSDGYIVTNNHVIDNSDEIEVSLNDNRKYKAKLIGTDPSTDIALLKIEEVELPYITFGNSDALKIGEWVLAVGNPFMLNSTVTAGIVSAKARSIGIIGNNTGQLGIESFIQTDAAVNPGNSGGALVNILGELVGINTAIFSQTGNFAGYSFAVPSSIVSKVVTDLKQYGTVQRAIMGITIEEIPTAVERGEKIDLHEGVYVREVSSGSGAADAGIKSGDVIISINGVTVKTPAQLQEQVSRYRPGDKIKVGFNRNGKNEIVDVTLKNKSGTTDVVKQDALSILGAEFGTVSEKERMQLGLRSNGVKVTKIGSGKLKSAGMRDGFIILSINNIRVNSPKEIEQIYLEFKSSQSSDQDKVLYFSGIYPNGKTAYYPIDLAE